MHRILTLPGRSAALRRARLEQVRAWMGTRGWRLADYAEEAGSALFERPADAPSLPLWDATRWLPGPRAWHPAQWWVTLRADPRLAVPPGAVLLVAIVLGAALFGGRSFDPQRLQREAAEAGWFVVTTGQLNVREGPAATQQQVGVLYRGQRVRVGGEVNGDWVRIDIPARGYVARAYLEPAGAPAD
jgi:hypothetical protein